MIAGEKLGVCGRQGLEGPMVIPGRGRTICRYRTRWKGLLKGADKEKDPT